MPFMHYTFCRQRLMFVLKIRIIIIQNLLETKESVFVCLSIVRIYHIPFGHFMAMVSGREEKAENASLCVMSLRPPKKIMTITEMFGILCRVSILRRRM